MQGYVAGLLGILFLAHGRALAASVRASCAPVSATIERSTAALSSKSLALVIDPLAAQIACARGEIHTAQRRGRDSNPRWTEPPIPVFETGAFNRSATSPVCGEPSASPESPDGSAHAASGRASVRALAERGSRRRAPIPVSRATQAWLASSRRASS